MARWFVCLMLLFSASSALASDWWRVAISNDDDAFFVDASSIGAEKNLKLAWIAVVSGNLVADGTRLRKSQYAVDCATGNTSMRFSSRYDDSQKLIRSRRFQGDEFEPTVPDSVFEPVVKFVCGGQPAVPSAIQIRADPVEYWLIVKDGRAGR